MKQQETERVEVYYEHIQKLAHGLQIPTIDNFLSTVFRTSLQSYLKIAITRLSNSYSNMLFLGFNNCCL